MEIRFGAHHSWTEEHLTKISQENLTALNKASSSTAVSEKDDGAEKQGDVINISEEARQKQQESSGASAQTGLQGTAGEEASEPADLKSMLKQQIQEIEKQLAKAKERLSIAKGGEARDDSEEKVQKAGEENVQDPDAKNARAAGSPEAEDGGEVKEILTEINQLSNTLATLNQQLLQEERRGASAGASGSAGISTGGEGRGGKGERIPLNA